MAEDKQNITPQHRADLIKRAIAEFGVTNNISYTDYMLENGSFLDMRQRLEDGTLTDGPMHHGMIKPLVDGSKFEPGAAKEGKLGNFMESEPQTKFMREAGATRIQYSDYDKKSLSVAFTKDAEPTKAQQDAILKMVRKINLESLAIFWMEGEKEKETFAMKGVGRMKLKQYLNRVGRPDTPYTPEQNPFPTPPPSRPQREAPIRSRKMVDSSEAAPAPSTPKSSMELQPPPQKPERVQQIRPKQQVRPPGASEPGGLPTKPQRMQEIRPRQMVRPPATPAPGAPAGSPPKIARQPTPARPKRRVMPARKPAPSQMPYILSPEGITMMIVAIFLDALGIIAGVLIFLFGIGLALSYIPDFLGLAIIGGWSWVRMGKIPLTKRIKKFIKRPLLATVGEMVPVVGILPLWTLYVIIHLRKS